MRSLLATVAVGALLGTAGVAQNAEESAISSVSEGDYFATTLIGSRLYTTEGELGEQVEYATVSESWNDVGEINDFIVGEDGSVRAVIVGVGGFLGIGEKDVAMSWDDVSVTQDSDGRRFLVVSMTQAELENAPTFEYEPLQDDVGAPLAMEGAEVGTEPGADGEAPAETAEGEPAMEEGAEAEMAEGEPAMEEETGAETVEADPATEESPDAEVAEGDMSVEEEADAALDASVEPDATMPEGYELVAIDQVSAGELEGATVRSSSDNEWLGEISTLVLNDAGEITQAVIDVGGFLGIGEKPVAMDFENLEIMRQGEGGPVEVHVTATREELEAMGAYEEG